MTMQKDIASPQSTDSQEPWEKKIDITFDRNNPPPKTRGEILFNALSWGFFGWIANAAISIKLADIATFRFRPFFIKNSAKLAETSLFKNLFNNDKERHSLARTFFSVVALLPGGFSVLIPIKWMEDRKTSIVTGLDDLIGPKNLSENEKKQIEARHEFIDQAPKIGWWDLVKGRFLPVSAVLTAHLSFASHPTNLPNVILEKTGSEKRFSGLDKIYGKIGTWIYERLSTSKTMGLNKAVDAMERSLDKGMKAYIENAKAEDKAYFFVGENRSTPLTGKNRMKEFVSNSVVDIGYSASVAFWTFVASHFFAFKDDVKRESNKQNHKQNVEPRRFQLETSPIESTPNTTISNKAPLTHIESAHYADRLMRSPAVMEQRTV